MKVFIQTKEKGKFQNDNFFKAYLGFAEMGLETVTFSNNRELRESNLEDVVVGYVGTVKSRLNDFGIAVPEMDYPDELERYLGRKVWKSKINDQAETDECFERVFEYISEYGESKKNIMPLGSSDGRLFF